MSEKQRKTDVKLTVADLRKIRDHAARQRRRRDWWGRFWWRGTWVLLLMTFALILWAIIEGVGHGQR